MDMIDKKFKKGIAMIELIFAIVVIGIVLLSTPLLIQQSINSGYIALQQEAIAEASTHTAILLSKHWDEEDANNTAGVAPIIQLTNEVAGSPFALAGIVDVNLSSRTTAVGEDNLTASTIGPDWNETSSDRFDDIDDYNNQSLGITLFNGEVADISTGAYVDQNITITTTVTFANDRPVSNFNQPNIDAGNNIYNNQDISPRDSNIKFVKVRLTSNNTDVPELNKSIILNAFSCNIGTYTFWGKQY
jgi:Tfp pilus assembly protein PilV